MNKWKLYTSKEIKPQGWLLRQLEIQAKGLSGNLHKIWPDIKDSAWLGGKSDDWERVPYWLDGFIPLAYLLENEEMIADAKVYIDAIIEKQAADGWLCPCSENKRPKYDTWALQLIAKTLTVYYECSGDERVPDVLYRALKNYYDLLKSGTISLFGWGKFRWFETFIALNFLKERYSDSWIAELAHILKEQGYNYDEGRELWKTPRKVWRFKTHIVNLTMMLKAEAVSCSLLGEEYTDKAEEYRKILADYNGTVFEGFTGDECLSGISPVQGTELCSVVEQMYSYELLFAFTGDNKWAERLEVLAFNALPATISEDMWAHQYDQMVNQIACVKLFPFAHFGTNGPRAHLFGLEPNFGCCTANFNQGFPKLALSAFMHGENKIINSIMLPCELKEDGVSIKLKTDYPFKNEAQYIITAEKEFDFVIRIPSFSENLKINGKAAETKDVLLHIEKGKTEIRLEFSAPAKLTERPGGLKAVKAGSLIFSLPVPFETKRIEYTRNGVTRKYPYCDYELYPKGDWNYAFYNADFSVNRSEIGEYPFSVTAPPVTVTANMQKINWGTRIKLKTVCRKAPNSLTPLSDKEEVRLFPYGCAKLRMTEMPLLNK